jgi:hypothetical protein
VVSAGKIMARRVCGPTTQATMPPSCSIPMATISKSSTMGRRNEAPRRSRSNFRGRGIHRYHSAGASCCFRSVLTPFFSASLRSASVLLKLGGGPAELPDECRPPGSSPRRRPLLMKADEAITLARRKMSAAPGARAASRDAPVPNTSMTPVRISAPGGMNIAASVTATWLLMADSSPWVSRSPRARDGDLGCSVQTLANQRLRQVERVSRAEMSPGG